MTSRTAKKNNRRITNKKAGLTGLFYACSRVARRRYHLTLTGYSRPASSSGEN
jgi:hypothetical protein